MELVDVLKVIWRWLWLIILIVATTCILVYLNPTFGIVDYRADVVLLVSTPDREDVSVLNDYVFTSDRDEVTIAINKFIEVAQYPEVRTRTLIELDIVENYGLQVDADLGADFVHVTVSASTPELAAEIANAHAANAIEYFGEIRALPANQAQTYFEAEISLAEQAVQDAVAALNTFQTEHNIVSFESELELQYTVLEQLEVSRAQLLTYQATGGRANTLDGIEPIAVTESDITSIDTLIDSQREVLANLAALEPPYDALQAEVERTRDLYDTLTSQGADVAMRGSFSSQAMFIQVIQPANLPTSPEDDTINTLSLAAVGSLGFAVLLAFFLDYISKRW